MDNLHEPLHFTMSSRNVDLERDTHYCFSITNSS